MATSSTFAMKIIEETVGRLIIHTETEHYFVGICKKLNSQYDWNLLLVVKQLDGNSWLIVVPVLMPAFGTISPMDYVRMVADYYERERQKPENQTPPYDESKEGLKDDLSL